MSLKLSLFSFLIMMGIPLTFTGLYAQTETQQAPAATTEAPVEIPGAKASEAAAQAWLKLVDEEHYVDSWNAASQILQFTMPRDEWVRVLNSVRRPKGLVSTRTLLNQIPAKDPRNMAPGNYMIILYQTSFSARNAKELLTLYQGQDGNWRVVTYMVD